MKARRAIFAIRGRSIVHCAERRSKINRGRCARIVGNQHVIGLTGNRRTQGQRRVRVAVHRQFQDIALFPVKGFGCRACERLRERILCNDGHLRTHNVENAPGRGDGSAAVVIHVRRMERRRPQRAIVGVAVKVKVVRRHAPHNAIYKMELQLLDMTL